MADKEITIRLTLHELELLKRALSDHETVRSSKGLSTDDCRKLEAKLHAAK